MKKTIGFILTITLCGFLSSAGAQTVSLPADAPFWPNATISVDTATIAEFASMYCAQNTGTPDAHDFFLSYLLLNSADQLCTAAPDRARVSTYLGNMYLAGLYGGVLLRDALFFSSDADPETIIDALMEMVPGIMRDIMSLGTDKLIFDAVASLASLSVQTSLRGCSTSVWLASRSSIELFTAILGFDIGLYSFFTSHNLDDSGPMTCPRLMDCSLDSVILQTGDLYAHLADRLHQQRCTRWWSVRDMRWCEMNMVARTVTAGTNGLVDELMGVMQKAGAVNIPEWYSQPLTGITARSVIVAQFAILPAMQAYAESRTTPGRCALLWQAGKIVWLGSFMLGMTSDLPAGVFPELVCP